jgi:hypothetical protein
MDEFTQLSGEVAYTPKEKTARRSDTDTIFLLIVYL